MGGSGSSSKRKSSKRKREKKKKIQRKETKRRRREYDSASSHSDDESLNSEHTSSFTAKSDRGRRKTKNRKLRRDSSLSSSFDDKYTRSDSDSSSTYDHKRKHRKGRRPHSSLRSTKRRDRKKLARKSSDSDVGNVRKRKREGRDVKSRKKSLKRSRKYLSSDSESCPTCRSDSDSGSDSKHGPRSKLITNGEKEWPRGRESDNNRNKQRVRSPYNSSYDQGSDCSVGVNDGHGAVTLVDNPRRLKSVISVVNLSPDEGENRWEVDPHKEVIVYDREDYPSPKSLDSYEGATKMESDGNSHGASSKRVLAENVVDEGATAPGKHKISDSGQNNAGIPQSAGEIEASAPAAALGGDDLESILRQKALENLRKFRGKPPIGPKCTNVKTNNEGDVSKLPAERVDVVQNKSSKPNSSIAREMNSINVPSLKRNFLQLNEAKESPGGEHIEKKGGTAQIVTVECPKEVKDTSSHTVLSNHDSREDASPGAGTANDCNSSMEKPTTSAGQVTGDNSSGQQNDDKDGSQFEQRTMTVMRGGEMVQVSYKVYIPKKAPALARRQLRR